MVHGIFYYFSDEKGCPLGQEFVSCAKQCPQRCADLQQGIECQEGGECQPGCRCPEGNESCSVLTDEFYSLIPYL